MKKTLAANETLNIPIDQDDIDGDTIIHLAIVSGSVEYSINETATDEESYVLNEDIRTDSIYLGDGRVQNIFVKAGAQGAVFQYRQE